MRCDILARHLLRLEAPDVVVLTDVVHNRRHLLREVQLVMLNDDDKETDELRFKITTKLSESEILRLLEQIKIEMPFHGHDHRGTYPAREVTPK